MSKKTRKPVPAAAVRPRKELVWLTVGALAAFLLLCLTNSNNIKVVAALTALATIAALLAGGDRLRGRLTWVAGAVALWVLMDGISTLYAVSGKFALYEFLKVLISFGVFVLILALSKENGQETGRRAAMLLEGCTRVCRAVQYRPDLHQDTQRSGPGVFGDVYHRLLPVDRRGGWGAYDLLF